MAKVAMGESQAGMWKPNESASMITPSTRMEYNRPVLQVSVSLHPLDVADRQLPEDEGADAVSDENEGDRDGEGECTDDPVDGEGGIDHLQVEELGHVGHVPAHHLSLLELPRSAGTRGR